GQPDFTSGTSNNGGVSATSLYNSSKVVADSSGGLFIADTNNNRVLYFSSGSTTASRVYGQPDFTSNTVGTSATSLKAPNGVALDSSGGLYVADSNNHRVLYFPNGSTTASQVYGQSDFTSSSAGTSATSLRSPSGVALDA